MCLYRKLIRDEVERRRWRGRVGVGVVHRQLSSIPNCRSLASCLNTFHSLSHHSLRSLIVAVVVAPFASRLPPIRRPRGIIYFGTNPTRGLHASRTPTYTFPCA